MTGAGRPALAALLAAWFFASAPAVADRLPVDASATVAQGSSPVPPSDRIPNPPLTTIRPRVGAGHRDVLLFVAATTLLVAGTVNSVAEQRRLALSIIVFNSVVYVVAAFGMFVLVFEDMTGELRETNRVARRCARRAAPARDHRSAHRRVQPAASRRHASARAAAPPPLQDSALAHVRRCRPLQGGQRPARAPGG